MAETPPETVDTFGTIAQRSLRELGYPSNLLSLARIGFIPPIVGALRAPDQRRAACWYVAVAMATDVVDGAIARWRGEESEIGKVLDPVADKLLVNVIAITLSETRNLPWWFASLILARDVGILLSGLMFYRHKVYITPPLFIGKLTTFVLSIALISYVAGKTRLGTILLSLWFGIGWISVFRYTSRLVKMTKTSSQPPSTP